LRRSSTLVFSILVALSPLFSQSNEWRRLVALESSRGDVEKILGKPETYFDTFGQYETSVGRFSVWYSTGECRKKSLGLQYRVPAKRMTRLYLRLDSPHSPDTYIIDKSTYVKTDSPLMANRYLYSSVDGSESVETIQRKDRSEFVNSITLQPKKSQASLVCNTEK
jgi:hypothetical protein